MTDYRAFQKFVVEQKEMATEVGAIAASNRIFELQAAQAELDYQLKQSEALREAAYKAEDAKAAYIRELEEKLRVAKARGDVFEQQLTDASRELGESSERVRELEQALLEGCEYAGMMATRFKAEEDRHDALLFAAKWRAFIARQDKGAGEHRVNDSFESSPSQSAQETNVWEAAKRHRYGFKRPYDETDLDAAFEAGAAWRDNRIAALKSTQASGKDDDADPR